MDQFEKERLSRLGDSSKDAIAFRLKVVRAMIGMSQTELAAEVGLKYTTYNSQEKAGSPSVALMRYLYRAHRVDFNFILHGDFAQLPSDVQNNLFEALANAETQ